MRAHHRGYLLSPHIFKDRTGKGCAFSRVRTRAELIEKDEIVLTRGPYDIGDIFHMSAEGGKRFLYGLGVAYIGKDFPKYRQGAAFSGYKKA